MLKRTNPVKQILFRISRSPSVLHQLSINCYSTRVSLNCSNVSQGIFGILEVFKSCLARKSKPMLLWGISCSMFCERFQQYWPHRVPVKCWVRLSFIFVMMTHHSCDHFRDRCWQNYSIRRSGRNNFPLPVSRKNGSLCEKGRLAEKNAEGARKSLLDACISWNMSRTSLLHASLRLSQTIFSSSCFMKFSEQFFTGSEFGIGNVDFIHETTLENIGCPLSIIV